QKKINQLEKEKESLYLFEEEKNSIFEEINKFDTKIQVPKIDFRQQTDNINNLIDSLTDKSEKLSTLNLSIKNELKQKGVEGDITYLLDKVKEYQTNIEHYLIEIQKIDELISSSSKQFESLSSSANNIKNDLFE